MGKGVGEISPSQFGPFSRPPVGSQLPGSLWGGGGSVSGSAQAFMRRMQCRQPAHSAVSLSPRTKTCLKWATCGTTCVPTTAGWGIRSTSCTALNPTNCSCSCCLGEDQLTSYSGICFMLSKHETRVSGGADPLPCFFFTVYKRYSHWGGGRPYTYTSLHPLP